MQSGGADFAPEIGARFDTRVAVVFGIEEYRYTSKASFAEHDAEIVREYFRKTLGIPNANVFFRTSGRATKAEFEKVFSPDGWLGRHITPGVTEVFVYYAGHGAPDLESKEPFLIPYDVDPNYANTGYSLKGLLESVSSVKPKLAHVFVDACFSGQDGRTGKNSALLADARGMTVVAAPSPPTRVNFFAAAGSNEVSSALPDASHGLFTYYLLKGLSGSADANSDNRLTSRELGDFITSNVPKKAVTLDRRQTPSVTYGASAEAVLVSGGGK